MEKKKKQASDTDKKATGTYRYDKKLGKVVKVSDQVPGLSKGDGDFGGGDSSSDSPCGSCPSGGSCGMGGGGFGGGF
ncbi:MAG: hypothetical protein PHF00_01725 [Elusimicrobia bacterium]|nr:hypothetical protein [Elusimicrobiota bacterium]